MTPKERVMNRFEGKEVDKIPNCNLIMQIAAKEIGCSYKEFITNYEKLVEGNIKFAEKYGIDFVTCMSDPMREAEGMGAEVVFPEDGVPYSLNHLIQDYDDISKVKVVNPRESERMLDRIKAVELYKEKVGDKYPIIGWVEGAFAEAADLRGLSEMMMDLIMKPEFCKELLEKTYEQNMWFAKEQIKAGADIIGVGDAAASLIGPELYEQFAFPYQKKMCEEIQEMGAKMKLHICGNIQPLLPKIKELGVDMLDVDHVVDFKVAVETFKGTKTCVSGNLDPVGEMERTDSDSIVSKTKALLEIADEKTFMAGGCEVPAATPSENLLAMNKILYL